MLFRSWAGTEAGAGTMVGAGGGAVVETCAGIVVLGWEGRPRELQGGWLWEDLGLEER